MDSLFCNQVRDSSSNKLHGCSKAQACLKKILHIISTVPPCEVPNSLLRGERGFGIDLNLRLDSLGTFLESEKSAENSFVGKEKETETDSSFGVEVNRDAEYMEAITVAEKATPEASSDITDLPKVEMQDGKGVESGDGKENGGDTGAAPFINKRRRDNDSLTLLIEAAEMISDMGLPNQEQKVAQSEEIKSGSEKKSWTEECEIGEFEDTSPVVRTRRGRSQVLPYRYRDSVLEPLRRPQRSAVVSKEKRRSK
ncbi:hypothetical protein SLE2022_004750 [Rubroshorea leprosula]